MLVYKILKLPKNRFSQVLWMGIFFWWFCMIFGRTLFFLRLGAFFSSNDWTKCTGCLFKSYLLYFTYLILVIYKFYPLFQKINYSEGSTLLSFYLYAFVLRNTMFFSFNNNKKPKSLENSQLLKQNLTCESNFWIDFRTMRS